MLVYRHDLNTFVIFPLFRDQEQIDLLRQQLEESTKVSENLRRELNVYEKLYKLSVQGRNREVQTEGMYGCSVCVEKSHVMVSATCKFVISYPC